MASDSVDFISYQEGALRPTWSTGRLIPAIPAPGFVVLCFYLLVGCGLLSPKTGSDDSSSTRPPSTDWDGDGWGSEADCDNLDPSIYPGAPERRCDGIDQDCDGADLLADADHDGSLCDEDCDEEDDHIHPGTRDAVCDGIDQDCDGLDAVEDLDGDGHDCRTDCDDSDPGISPDKPDIPCDRIDQDCDGIFAVVDADADGVDCISDCDDADPSVSPITEEIPCDGLDQDCDGADLLQDADKDYSFCILDCNEHDPLTHPDATEIPCDGIDQDCDGTDALLVLYVDGDADGYGSPAHYVAGCLPMEGMTLDHSDCDDTDPGIHPWVQDICDGIDQDCDGLIDEYTTDTWYLDLDGDGYGDPSTATASEYDPVGYVNNGDDCDDWRDDLNPDSPELCDDLDNDCDGVVDNGLAYPDADLDGYGSEETSLPVCDAPTDWILQGGDCDDEDEDIFPDGYWDFAGDGIDGDCDGSDDIAIETSHGAYADSLLYDGGIVSYMTVSMVRGQSVGDVNGDGTQDLYMEVFTEISWHHKGSDRTEMSVVTSIPSGVMETVDATTLDIPDISITRFPVAAVGDLDEDGLDEALIGISTRGCALWIENTQSNVLYLPDIPYHSCYVKTAGDINGDGLVEVMAGEPDCVDGGRTWLIQSRDYESADSITDLALASVSGETASDSVGEEFTGLGDLNGDGYGEVAFLGEDHYGIFHGPLEGDRLLSEADVVIRGEVVSGAASGDVDGDGLDDLVVPAREPDWGVHVFTAPVSSAGLACADAHVLGTTELTGVEDLDQDGLDDIIVYTYFVMAPISGTRNAYDSIVVKAVHPLHWPEEAEMVNDLEGDGVRDILTHVPSDAMYYVLSSDNF